MTASEYVVGRGAAWTPRAALAALGDRDRERLPDTAAKARASMAADRAWLVNRLTLLWLVAGYRKGEAAATAWLGEMTRLLGDVPADILAVAIDEAVARSERGFIPSAGEILAIARPEIAARQQAIRRIELMAAAAHAAPAPALETPRRCTAEQAAEILREMGWSADAATPEEAATA